jgi:hypothetical protein
MGLFEYFGRLKWTRRCDYFGLEAGTGLAAAKVRRADS